MVKKTKEKKENKITANKRKIIEILIFSFVIIYVIYFFTKLIIIPVKKTNIVYGKILEENDVEAYIIRDENILDTNGTTDINLAITEGSRAGKNEKIGMYENQNKEEWEEKIGQLDVKIQEAMKEQNNIYSNDIQNIENQVEMLIQNINTTNQIQLIMQYENEINQLLAKKAKITGELSPSGSYIKELIQERAKYETNLNESTNYIKANASGVVSTKIDGLEEKLLTNRINELENPITYKELENYNVRTDEIVATNRKKIKIIDNYACYLVINITDSHKNSISLDSKIKVRLNNGNIINATVYKIVDEEDSKTVFLKITQDVEYLIDYRKISLDIIWWEYEGWKIPNKCIEYEEIQISSADESGQSVVKVDKVPYVKLLKYNKEYIVYIDIKKQNNDYSIIDNISDESTQKYSLKDKNIKELSLYDELILN